MKTPKQIQQAKTHFNDLLSKTELSAIPLGYLAGAELTVTDSDIIVNPLIVNVRGKQVLSLRSINIRDMTWTSTKTNSTRYYIYVNRFSKWFVDAVEPVYVQDRIGKYNPRTSDVLIGTFYVDADGNYVKVIYPDGTIDMEDNPLINVDYIDFDLENGVAAAEGRLVWNDEDGTLNLGLKGGNVNLQIGLEQVIRVKNTSGSDIGDGKAVRITGAAGANPEIGLSEADVPATAESVGLTTETIINNQFGYVTTFGMVRDINTSGSLVGETWSDGDRIYLSNTAGELTDTLPIANERKVFMGIVARAHATEGSIWVHPLNIYYIEELSGNNDGAGGSIIYIDQPNKRVGIGIAAPSDPFHAVGRIRIQEPGDTSNFVTLEATADNMYLSSYGAVANSGGMFFRVNDASITAMTILANGNVGIGTTTPTVLVSANEKAGMTAEGGHAIRVTNKSGATSTKGFLVEASSTTDNAVTYTTNDDIDCIGVVYEAGIADGSEMWVVVAGIADVYYGGAVTRGTFSRVPITGDGYNTGEAINEALPSPPFATDKHFGEIGHPIESIGSAGLAKTILHFN